MNRTLFATLAASAALAALPALFVTPAQAQVDVYIGSAPPPAPPRGGAWGDRDRDGIPNAYDRRDNRRGPYGDRDRDGIPNAYDRFDNRMVRDRDRDGVPDRWDRNPNNPYR